MQDVVYLAQPAQLELFSQCAAGSSYVLAGIISAANKAPISSL